MGTVSFTDPTIGNPFASEAAVVDAALQTLRSWANGDVDNANIATAELARLGLSDNASTRRGAVSVPASESRTNTAYGLMPTADQVAGVSLPTNGLLFVAYQATWQESVVNAGRAAIFLGANQLKQAQTTGSAPVVQETALNAAPSANVAKPLVTTPNGLFGLAGDTTGYTGDATTGQLVGVNANGLGGACVIFAAAGTYNVSVQFKASSGSVTVANRRLFVWTVGF
jgi:hypothetical protein